MDSKNRLAIAIAITCLIVVAIFASFGRSLFFVHIPSITLSDASSEEPPASGSSGPEAADQYWQVDVTPETVQSIVATLIRPDSYYRELTVETLWSGGSFSSSVQYWQDRAWSHTRQDLASGAVRHDLAGPEEAYYWYEGSSPRTSAPTTWPSTSPPMRRCWTWIPTPSPRPAMSCGGPIPASMSPFKVRTAPRSSGTGSARTTACSSPRSVRSTENWYTA